MDNEADFSVKQLKANLKTTLQNSGVLGTVKAQIRQEFIRSLSAKQQQIGSKLGEISITDRVLYSAVFELLSNRGLVNSISVFLAETGLDPKQSILNVKEVTQLIKINEISSVLRSFQSTKSLNQLESEIVDPTMTESGKVTVLDLLVRFCTTSREVRKEICTQTEHGGLTAREALDETLQDLRNSFKASQSGATSSASTATTIQERMIAYQRDCERRMQSEVATQVAHMRETELTRVRLEEAAKARVESEALRRRLELDYARRLQTVVDSEAALALRIANQEQGAQRSLYEARQQMQREIEDLRAREAAATRRLELEAQGVRMLELRLKLVPLLLLLSLPLSSLSILLCLDIDLFSLLFILPVCRESLGTIEGRETDLSRRERALEERRAAATEEARREAGAHVHAQLELLSRERASLLQERQHFLDQQAAHSALVEGAKGVREQLRQAREEALAKDEEVQALQRRILRADLQRQEEEELVRKVSKAQGTELLNTRRVGSFGHSTIFPRIDGGPGGS